VPASSAASAAMVAVGLQEPADASASAQAPALHACSHCGEPFASRNALFKHLAQRCDPDAREGQHSDVKRERVVLVIGYLGSKYHGLARNLHDETHPTVEGEVLSAARRAWGDAVCGMVSCTKTEKGMHAAENVLVATLRRSVLCDAASFCRGLEESEVRLLAPPAPAPQELVEGLGSAQRRVYRCYIPYAVLVPVLPSEEVDSDWLWVTRLPQDCTADEILDLCRECGCSPARSDVVMKVGSTGNAELRLPPADAARLRARLRSHGFRGDRVTPLVLPLGEARSKLRVQGLVREALKKLRGQGDGLRSFHNFVPGEIPGSAQAMRALKHCSIGLCQERQGVVEEGRDRSWLELDYAVLVMSAKSFASQQLRRMVGALVAVVRGVESLEYLDRCFSEAQVPTPAAPAEAFSLDSTTILKSREGRWRRAVGLEETASNAVRLEIEARIIAESRRPWAEFVNQLEAGATRSAVSLELAASAAVGDLAGVEVALDGGAQIDFADKYGQTALFLAAREGHTGVVEALRARGANVDRPANGGSTPFDAAMARGHAAVVTALREAGARQGALGSRGRKAGTSPAVWPKASIRVLIPQSAAHAGAGTLVVDGAFDEAFLEDLEALWRRLPVAAKEKASPTERAYFSDAEGWVVRELDRVLAEAGLPVAGSALPQMRFLWYPEPGGRLPAHVDLPRTSAGARTTCSFLLYLADCCEGGETLLLEGLDGDAALVAGGGVAAGERGTMAAVSPRRGRLLLMPHACPHSAAATVSVPKVLLRGDVLPPQTS